MNAPKVPLYARQNDNSYSVLTARAVLRSDWQAREALTLQNSLAARDSRGGTAPKRVREQIARHRARLA